MYLELLSLKHDGFLPYIKIIIKKVTYYAISHNISIRTPLLLHSDIAGKLKFVLGSRVTMVTDGWDAYLRNPRASMLARAPHIRRRHNSQETLKAYDWGEWEHNQSGKQY